MADTKAVLLGVGKRLITGALTGFSPIGPHSFRVGDAAGFVPSVNDTDITGDDVFTGYAGLMQARRIADDTVRYTLTIPESKGPFSIGNIVMYGTHYDNEPTPFIKVVLPFKVVKRVSNPDLNNPNPFPEPGNRFVINITLKHSVTETIVSAVTVTPQNFAGLPFYDTSLSIPPPAMNPYNQYVVHNHFATNSPTIVVKKANGQSWGISYMQNIRSPKFGIIDGGNVGDNHLASNYAYAWGQFFLTPNEYYSGQIGGSSFTDQDSSFLGSVGGLSF
jgi:hypothetical protein